MEVPTPSPQVTDEDIARRIEQLRESEGGVRQRRSASRPRTATTALVTLEAVAGLDGEPMKQDEINIENRRTRTPYEAFTEALRGARRAKTRELNHLPEGYDRRTLAGKTVRFRDPAEADPVEGAARAERRVRPRTWATSRTSDELRDRVQQVALLTSARGGAPGSHQEAWSRSSSTCTISRCPRPMSSSRSRSSRAAAPAAGRFQGVDPGRSSSIGTNCAESQQAERATRDVRPRY